MDKTQVSKEIRNTLSRELGEFYVAFVCCEHFFSARTLKMAAKHLPPVSALLVSSAHVLNCCEPLSLRQPSLRHIQYLHCQIHYFSPSSHLPTPFHHSYFISQGSWVQEIEINSG